MQAFDPDKRYIIIYRDPADNGIYKVFERSEGDPTFQGSMVEESVIRIAQGKNSPAVMVGEVVPIEISAGIKDTHEEEVAPGATTTEQ